jgi:hypothetical protein
MEQRGFGSNPSGEEDLAMVEFRDILPWIIIRKLDTGFYDGGNWSQLVAKHLGHLC